MKKVMIAALVLLCARVYANQESAASAAEEIQKKPNPVVKMVTTHGEIVIELYADKAPITVDNFLKYTKEGFYTNTIFHRVIEGFMIQGGGLSPEMANKKTQKPIKNESYNKLRNKRGTLAMARKNPPDSATSQFFINHADNKALDFDGPYKPGYAVFGEVIKGMDVVDKIASVKTTHSQYYDEEYKQVVPCQDVPAEPIVIKSITLVEKETPQKEKTQADEEPAPKEDKKE